MFVIKKIVIKLKVVYFIGKLDTQIVSFIYLIITLVLFKIEVHKVPSYKKRLVDHLRCKKRRLVEIIPTKK